MKRGFFYAVKHILARTEFFNFAIMIKLVNLNLPPVAWLSDEELEGRNVLLHVRSASVIEILEDLPGLNLNDGVIKKKFIYLNRYGFEEKMVAVLHYSTILTDEEFIESGIFEEVIDYYKADCDRMDQMDWEERKGSQN